MEKFETHSPSGIPHAQFILDYYAEYEAANGPIVNRASMPKVWDRKNGWINITSANGLTSSYRRGDIEKMTERLRSRVTA